jgi:uncharacterized protein YecT (DUF1311 family)
MQKLYSVVVCRSLPLALAGIVTIALLGGCGSNASPDPATTIETITPTPDPGSPWKIGETGVGPIQFGMTMDAVRSLLSADMTLTPEPNLLVDWDAMTLKEKGTPLLYLLYPAGKEISDQSTVALFMVADSRYTTPEGIGPGSTIAAAQEVYGPATLSYNTDDEMREYVRFAQAPSYLSFRTTGSPGQWVGRYSGSADGSYYETQDFDPEGKIQFVLVDGFLTSSKNSPSSGVQSTTNQSETNPQDTPSPGAESGSELNCSDPQTTLDINACSKQSHDSADRTLNEVYAQIAQGLDPRAADQLQGAEEAWLNFRDAHCSQYSQTFVGGTAYPSFLLGCLTRTTEERIGYLRQELGVFGADERTYPDLGVVTVEGQSLDCRKPDSTPVTNYCAQLSYEQSDRRLNEVYQNLSGTLEDSEKAALTEAQLAWLDYRDQHCAFAVREAMGGTGYEAYRNNCLEDLTRDRTEELKVQLDR